MLSEALTPEQRKAIKVVQECLPLWHQYLCDDVTRSEICFTDYKAFTTQKVSYSDLHHGTNWTWNQSNAKKKVVLENDIAVIVQKFNTRKKRKNTPCPNGIIFKLWMFSIYKNSDNSFLGIFIWCEKGYPPLNTYYVPQQQQQVQMVSQDNYYNVTVAPPPVVSVEDDYIFNNSCSNDPIYNYYNYTGVPPTLTLEDLDFLRPFVDDQTAASLGW